MMGDDFEIHVKSTNVSNIDSVDVCCTHQHGRMTSPLTSLLSNADRKLVEWYLEEYWRWPYEGFEERADSAEKLLSEIGQRLFNFVLPEERMRQAFSEWRKQSTSRSLVIISDGRRAHGLPWELLHDGTDFLVTGTPPNVPIVRAVTRTTPSIETLQLEAPELRVLLIVARPTDTSFVDPRIVAREIVDEIASKPTNARVVLEFLRPPTLDALKRRLANREHPVHIVHFDGHGRNTQGGPELVFETPEGRTDCISAAKLADTIRGTGVYAIVLTACKSASTDRLGIVEGIPAALLEGGVKIVVAMSHVLLASTAALYSESLYRQVATGKPFVLAHHEASKSLARNRARHDTIRKLSLPHHKLSLADWWIPQLYLDHDILYHLQGPTTPSSIAEGQRVRRNRNSRNAQFRGRSRELIVIERVLRNGAAVMLTGLIGIGKTALIRECADWFISSGLCSKAYYISINDKSYLRCLDKLIGSSPTERTLRSTPHVVSTLLVLDDIPNGATELWRRIAQLSDNFGTDIALIFACRAIDNAEMPAIGRPIIDISLTGLDSTEAYSLAAEQLARLGIDPATVTAYDVNRVLEDAGYHPLAAPISFENNLQKLIAGKKPSDSIVDRQVLEQVNRVRTAWTNLSSEYTQHALLLNVFREGARETAITNIANLSLLEWDSLRVALQSLGLVSSERLDYHKDDVYIRFHPAWSAVIAELARPNDQLTDIQARYSAYFLQLGRFLYYYRAENARVALEIARVEMPNMLRAFRLLLNDSRRNAAANLCEYLSDFLRTFGRDKELESAYASLSAAVDTSELLSETEWLIESGRAEYELQTGDYRAATIRLRTLLGRIESDLAEDGLGRGSIAHCVVLDLLARCVSEDGQFDAAEHILARACSMVTKLFVTESAPEPMEDTANLYLTLMLHHGDVLERLGEHGKARANYEEVVKWSRTLGFGESTRRGLSKLADQAFEHDRDYQRAYALYTEALQLAKKANDRLAEGATLHSLGRLARAVGNFDMAERYYRESLAIDELRGDDEGAAISYGALGTLALDQKRASEAVHWFTKEVDVCARLQPGGPAHAGALNGLAMSLLEMAKSTADNQLSNTRRQDLIGLAERYVKDALNYQEALSGVAGHGTWVLLHNLASIAKLKQDQAKEFEYRKRARQAYAASVDNRKQIEQQLAEFIQIVERARNGDTSAHHLIINSLPGLEESGWHIAEATRRILDGETDWHSLADGLEEDDALAVLLLLETSTRPQLDSQRTGSEGVDFESFVSRVTALLPESVQAVLEKEHGDLDSVIFELNERDQKIVRAAMAALNAHAWDLMMVAIHSAMHGSGDEENSAAINWFMRMIDGGEGKVRSAVRMIERGERDRAKLVAGLNSREKIAVDRLLELSITDTDHLPARVVEGRLLGGSAELARCLNDLGVALLEGSRPEDAEYYLEAAAYLVRKLGGVTDPNAVSDMKNLAAAYEQQGKHERAAETWRRIITIEETAEPRNTAILVKDLGYLGDVYNKWERYEEAKKCYKRAVQLATEVRFSDWSDFALDVFRLAECHLNLGEHDECRILLEEQLGEITRELGNRNGLARQSKGLLAREYERIGDNDRALEIWRSNIEGCQADQDATEVEIGAYYGNLGRCFLADGQLDQAYDSFVHSYHLLRAAFGLVDRRTIVAIKDVAGVLLQKGCDMDAVELVQEAIGSITQEHGISALQSRVDALISPFMHCQRYQAAETLLKNAYRIYNDTLGESHRATIEMLSHLAIVCALDGKRHKEAAGYLERSIKLKEQHLGGEPALLEDDLRLLAVVQCRVGNWAGAHELLERLISLRKRLADGNVFDLIDDMRFLATVRTELGQFEEAANMLEDIVSAMEEHGQVDPDELESRLKELTALYTRLGRPELTKATEARTAEEKQQGVGLHTDHGTR